MKRFVYLISTLSLLLVSGCSKTEPINLIVLGEVKNCDSAEKLCVYKENNVNASLLLGDGKGVGELKPFTAQFSINTAAEEVMISFVMKDMDMGPNLYRMKSNENKWIVKPMLPICSVSRLDWIAEIQWKEGNKQYKLAFPFHTDGVK